MLQIEDGDDKLEEQSYQKSELHCKSYATTRHNRKRYTNHLHFLHKTRRKSYKAALPTTNVRKRQTLNEFWLKLLPSYGRKLNGVTQEFTTQLIKCVKSTKIDESSARQIKSNTFTSNNQLVYNDKQCYKEMELERNIKRSKSETSLSTTYDETSKVTLFQQQRRQCVSLTKEHKFRACEVKAQLSCFSAQLENYKCRRSTSNSGSSKGKHYKRSKFVWPRECNNYFFRSNNTSKIDGSYHRRSSQAIERLCTRKKIRLRRRRKRKELIKNRERNLQNNEDHKIGLHYEQLATTNLINLLAKSVALNALEETHPNENASHAEKQREEVEASLTAILEATTPAAPAQTKAPFTKTTTTIAAKKIFAEGSTSTRMSSLSSSTTVTTTTEITKAAQNHLLPATPASLPNRYPVSYVHSNSNCCNGNATVVEEQQQQQQQQQHFTKNNNRLATAELCCTTTKSVAKASSAAALQLSKKAANATATATTIANKATPPAIRLSAFYAITTLRLFLTTLTTLIASTTPTTFTATKYSWIFLWIYVNLTARVGLAGYHEKRLLHDLLDPYNTLERPVLNESDPLQLSFGLTLMQIIDVDEKNQLLVTNVWLKLEWNDMNLRWNTSDYGGVKDLRIPPHRIWKPDVLMYNSADEGFDGTYQTNVVVRNNGSCLYVPPGIFKSTCKIDITWFPFDDQRCEMKFGSWTYDGFQLDLQLQDETGGDISSYVLNGEWELLGVPGKRNEIYYNCCPEPYIDITFAIIIRRRTLYYFFNLIIPCVLIASMALLGFTLPPDSGEKLSLGVTILLSLTVFLNMVAETMPATSDAVPLLGTYFNCIMFMVASSVVSTILILNYHHRNADTHEMSEWIRIVFLCWLPWILRMSRPGRPLILEFPTTPCSDTSSERKHQILSDVELKERQGDDGSIGPIGSTRMPDAVTHHTCIKSATEYELGLILKEIRFITDQLRKEDEENDIANDWKFAAMVVDRLCLIIFTMFTILATIAVLLSAPHIIVS